MRSRLLPLLVLAVALGSAAVPSPAPDPVGTFVVTQLPAGTGAERRSSPTDGMLPVPWGEGARIVLVRQGAQPRVLTEGFHSAADPEISPDGRRLLFAGRKTAAEAWDIYEMDLDGGEVRQITSGIGDCRSPVYQGTLFTLDSREPWHQITFVSRAEGTLNEYGPIPATALYSCKVDGSEVRRLTFNPSSSLDPTMLPDGRILFSQWQRGSLDRGFAGRVALFAVNIDGIDYAVFSAEEGRRVKLMPCVTSDQLVVFVEGERVAWDGAGTLGSVSLRRNLHSYRPVTKESDGLFHSPSPLPDGSILVSRRPADGSGTHGVHRLDPRTGRFEPLFDDPGYHDIQAKAVGPRPKPDGRSTVLTPERPNGAFYCLDVRESDLTGKGWIDPGVPRRVRVLEGIPRAAAQEGIYTPAGSRMGVSGPGSSLDGIPALIQRRILGEFPLESDGSFHIEVPANLPVQFQVLDADGMALQTCDWIWARNREVRGCVGCHEDGERTPENVFVEAVRKPAIPLTLPPQRRRTVDFRRDVMPIVARKCATPSCHGDGRTTPLLEPGLDLVAASGPAAFNKSYISLLAANPGADGPFGRYVHPGRARTSPLIWHLFGRITSRPWDPAVGERSVKPMPPRGAEPLTEGERRTFVEWIDMGALWDGIPGDDGLPGAEASVGRKGG